MSGAAVDVLVVGAGPSGLALALQAASLGARVRIVERRTDAFRPSRALIVHPRTLEGLRPLGVTGALLARGRAAPRVNLHLGARVVRARLGPFAIDDTAFPYLVFVGQATVEEVLAEALAGRGVDVERGVELTGLQPSVQGAPAGGAVAELRLRDGSGETLTARYVAACDGSASTVRRWIGAEARMGRYRHEVVLADVELGTDLDPDVGHMAVGRSGLVFLLALQEQATWRVLATVPVGSGGDAGGELGGADVQRLLDDVELPATVTDVAWSARIGLEHRLAARYRRGPVFLVGDAAHTHSPAGGQGMNTGIQDALNLGWRLAFAAARAADRSDRSTEELLDSYGSERRPVARRVLAATRALFWIEAGTDPVARFLRSGLGPVVAPLVPVLLGRDRAVAWSVRWLSQLRIGYRTGAPVRRTGRRLRPGRRLPDRTLGDGTRRLHDLTAAPGVHVLFERDAPSLGAAPWGTWVHVHRLGDEPGTGVTIVRPDGHIGYRSDTVDARRITVWLQSIGAIGAIGR